MLRGATPEEAALWRHCLGGGGAGPGRSECPESVVAWLVQLEVDNLGRKHNELALSVECCCAVVV